MGLAPSCSESIASSLPLNLDRVGFLHTQGKTHQMRTADLSIRINMYSNQHAFSDALTAVCLALGYWPCFSTRHSCGIVSAISHLLLTWQRFPSCQPQKHRHCECCWVAWQLFQKQAAHLHLGLASTSSSQCMPECTHLCLRFY